MNVSPDSALELLRSGEASRTEKIFLADGLLTMDTIRLLQCLTILGFDADEDVRGQARRTLRSLPLTDIVDTASSSSLPADTIDLLVRFFPREEKVLAGILANPSTADRTVALVATLNHPNILLSLGRNFRRIDACPAIMERLRDNPSTPTRILEAWAERQKLHGETPGKAAPPAPGAAGEGFSAALTDELELPGTAAGREEGPAEKDRSVKELLGEMSAGRKTALALKGNSEVRRILITDRNRSVCEKVLENPMITESEVEFYARLTSLSTDVLRKIGSHREWSRNPSVAAALVGNPKTPLGLSMKIVGRLGVRDLKSVAASRNLPETLRHAAGTIYEARRSSGA